MRESLPLYELHRKTHKWKQVLYSCVWYRLLFRWASSQFPLALSNRRRSMAFFHPSWFPSKTEMEIQVFLSQCSHLNPRASWPLECFPAPQVNWYPSLIDVQVDMNDEIMEKDLFWLFCLFLFIFELFPWFYFFIVISVLPSSFVHIWPLYNPIFTLMIQRYEQNECLRLKNKKEYQIMR